MKNQPPTPESVKKLKATRDQLNIQNQEIMKTSTKPSLEERKQQEIAKNTKKNEINKVKISKESKNKSGFGEKDLEEFTKEWYSLTNRRFDENYKCFIGLDKAQEMIRTHMNMNKKYNGEAESPTTIQKGYVLLDTTYFGLPAADHFKPEPKPTIIVRLEGGKVVVGSKSFNSGISNVLLKKIEKAENKSLKEAQKSSNSEKKTLIVPKTEKKFEVTEADRKFVSKWFKKNGKILVSTVKEAGNNIYLKSMFRRLVQLNIAKESAKGWVIIDSKLIS